MSYALRKTLFLLLFAPLPFCCGKPGSEIPSPESPAAARAAAPRPDHFPARIWAAADFERLRKDVLWSGRSEQVNIPVYPGNTTALRAAMAESRSGVLLLSITASDYPRMGASNRVYFRYFLRGTDALTVRLFNLDQNLSHSLKVSGLVQGSWSEATADFSAAEPDSAESGPIREGERMGGLTIMAETLGGQSGAELIVDDVICFSEKAGEGNSDNEPFPRRVILVRGFDPLEYYHPWTHTDYQVIQQGLKLENDWGVARGLESPGENLKRIRLIVDPPQAVGENTRLRFRGYCRQTARVQAMIFDLTDSDNRHIVLGDLAPGLWQTVTLNFTREGVKNDGNQTEFSAGHRVDDLFFLVWPEKGGEAEMLIDDLVLYDAGER
ncbi:MAG: hypothetical protein A3F83_13800 [Candidatus Glassbacteria bacterium RIFCSPLOWO2_12_FULL_58_11]|uniref:CBM11 domain-containing protein n=1 Tax=Candidatus Glassbacteria bacterium RIFCSPLOWO2_12_FULL_58_11 TaxID=1817867 RepID=A0A1F5YYN9_9BACT|nr:MAG: hypothetical protein A3F83_13800 [Candidatus Glassbacteria bacterium RIFCSPLOWO2_12_FULL_58_11]